MFVFSDAFFDTAVDASFRPLHLTRSLGNICIFYFWDRYSAR